MKKTVVIVSEYTYQHMLNQGKKPTQDGILIDSWEGGQCFVRPGTKVLGLYPG